MKLQCDNTTWSSLIRCIASLGFGLLARIWLLDELFEERN